jgi:hypothetical protein
MAYVTLADVRGIGIPDTIATDDRVEDELIPLSTQVIDRVTRQWFEERSGTFELDGTQSDTLHLPVPIIEITEVRINSSSDALDASYYRVYNGRAAPSDDRRNPRIKLIAAQDRNIFTAPILHDNARLLFRKGRKNQTIVGTFGYVEADDTTPLLIKRAALKMIAYWVTNPIYTPPGGSTSLGSTGGSAGAVVEEETDGHRIKYADVSYASASTRPGLSGLIPDPEVHEILLKLYRAPITVAASGVNWTVSEK